VYSSGIQFFLRIHRYCYSCRLEGVFKFLAAALTSVMRAAVPIPAVAAASVLHSAAVGGSVAGDVGAL